MISLKVGDEILTDDLSIAESMSSFFYTSEDYNNFPEFEYRTESRLSMIVCSANEVAKLLKNLNVYKSPGPDELPSTLLNLSFSQGKPVVLESANIIPVYKKGSKSKRENYCQILLMSIVCKIGEKVVKRVVDFWTDLKIFNSTLTQLLSCYDNWAKSRNKSNPTDVILLDLSY